VCKFFSLCFTLGSGASGGIFTPSLFLGATLGAACGAIINYYFPQLHISQIYFVVAGMAGMLASVTGALITAIIFTLEITKDYHIALPILVTIISGTLMRILVYPKGIYTFKLYQHGIMFNRKL
jgi:CIC family chloride channel protein